jgi:hypothetical protein
VKRNVPDDIKDLVWTDEEAAAAMKAASKGSTPKKVQARSKSRFTIFPDEWDYQLARVEANGCTYRVAIDLLREVWRSQSNRMKLPNVALKQRNVSRWSKQRALDQLEEAGLISIERHARKSPIVVVKFMD